MKYTKYRVKLLNGVKYDLALTRDFYKHKELVKEISGTDKDTRTYKVYNPWWYRMFKITPIFKEIKS